MKRCLSKMGFFLLALVFFSGFTSSLQSSSSLDCSSCANNKLLFPVSFSDLEFEEDGIRVNLNGAAISVSLLTKVKGQWFATYASYCSHNLCTKCRCCHLLGCESYVNPRITH